MANEFTSHALNPSGQDKCKQVEVLFDMLLGALKDIPLTVDRSPPPTGNPFDGDPRLKNIGGREQALVVTKLQEAKMWATRAVALDPENWAVGPNLGAK